MTCILPRRNNWLTWRLAAWLVLATVPAAAQETTDWKTGPALRQQLAGSTSIVWSERPLREGLASLARASGVAIFLDRRVDPTQPVTIELNDQPLERLLSAIAAEVQAEVALLGNVIYVGPRDTAGKLAIVAALRRQEASRLPARVQRRLLRSEAWAWQELAEPRGLLDDLAAAARVEVVNAELVPHDLWPAVSLPPLPWTDCVSLLLANFGLTFEWAETGGAIRLVPLPDDVQLTKSYSLRGTKAPSAGDLRRLLPAAKFKIERGRLVLTGSQDDHDRLAELLNGEAPKSSPVPSAQKVYTLTVENQPAGAVVRRVADQLGKELKYDPAVLPRLRQNVSIAVKEVSLEELLTTTLAPLGLTYKLNVGTLEIVLTSEDGATPN